MASKPDFVLKLERARGHLNDLEIEVKKWVDRNRDRFRTERDPERSDTMLVFSNVEPITPNMFSLLIGDALHNLRGSLDHLAYAITANEAKPFTKELAEASEFPIFGDKRNEGIAAVEKRYENAFAEKIGGMLPTTQTLIKSLQPYQRGNRYIDHPLWILHQLSNVDKHRLLVPVAGFTDIMLTTWPDSDVVVRNVEFHGGIINRETPIAHVTGLPPSGEMNMEFSHGLKVVFSGGGSIGTPAINGKDMLRTLSDIHVYIGTTVLKTLATVL